MIKKYMILSLKVLMRNKFFTFVSLFGISFTLMILLIATAFLDNMIGPAYPEKNHKRTLYVLEMEFSGETRTSRGSTSYYFLNKYVKSLKTPEKVSIFSMMNPVSCYYDNNSYDAFNKFTDAEFWEVLGFEFLEGKAFNRNDVNQQNYVTVINESTKKKFFGSKSAIGEYIEIDWKKYRVIGVVKDVPITRVATFSDIYTPISTTKEDLQKYNLESGNYLSIVLAKSRSDFAAIKSEFQQKIKQIEFLDDTYTKARGGTDTLLESVSREMFAFDETKVSLVITIIIFCMILFMILPAINLININLNRIIERHSEIGIRKSFGASSSTLIGQFVTENVILTFFGGIIGLCFTFIILQLINASGWIPYANYTINFRIFLYAMGIILFFGLFSGVYPAFRMSRLHPVEALNGDKQ